MLNKSPKKFHVYLFIALRYSFDYFGTHLASFLNACFKSFVISQVEVHIFCIGGWKQIETVKQTSI